MKKLLFVTLASFGLILFLAMQVPSIGNDHSSSTSGNFVTTALPDSIFKIVSNSCTDCHASGGNPFAESHLNFDKWSDLKPEKQAEKANAMCKVMTKGSMPQKSFREAHPDRVPNQKQINTICNWASALNK